VGFLWFFLLLTDEKKERKFIKLCLIPGGVAEVSFPSGNDEAFFGTVRTKKKKPVSAGFHKL
jgi:hypothetical protein